MSPAVQAITTRLTAREVREMLAEGLVRKYKDGYIATRKGVRLIMAEIRKDGAPPLPRRKRKAKKVEGRKRARK